MSTLPLTSEIWNGAFQDGQPFECLPTNRFGCFLHGLLYTVGSVAAPFITIKAGHDFKNSDSDLKDKGKWSNSGYMIIDFALAIISAPFAFLVIGFRFFGAVVLGPNTVFEVDESAKFEAERRANLAFYTGENLPETS